VVVRRATNGAERVAKSEPLRVLRHSASARRRQAAVDAALAGLGDGATGHANDDVRSSRRTTMLQARPM
jgi:hypothetical protein